ncbi:MAG: class I SAM-dependent methyltransferase [Desulfovibrio sp.]
MSVTDGKLRIFFYREGEHFKLPHVVKDAWSQHIETDKHLIPLLNNSAGDYSNPELYEMVDDPSTADFIVFPYCLHHFTGTLRPVGTSFFVKSLPFFKEYEQRHVFYDDHDVDSPLCVDSVVVRVSLGEVNRDTYSYAFPYPVLDHVLNAEPQYDVEKLRYDTNFMGALSHPSRVQLLQGILKESRLQGFYDYPDSQNFTENSYLHIEDEDKKENMEERYIRVAAQSKTVLAPRGMGRNSFRFYETMCLGRMPILVSDGTVLPFEDEIDYSEFCLRVPESALEHSGFVLHNWLRKHSDEELLKKFRRARSVWEEWFSNHKLDALFIKILKKRLAQGDMPPRAQCAHELLEFETRDVYPEGYHSGIVLDDREFWFFKGFNLSQSQVHESMISINEVDGWMSGGDVEYLHGLAAGLPEGGRILEIGSFMGLSSATMGTAMLGRRNMDARLYCVDTWEGSVEHQDMDVIKESKMYDVFQRNIRSAHIQDFIIPMRMDSVTASKKFRDETLDAVFIDGDHRYEGVLADLRSWYPKVKSGGIVIGHDLDPDSDVERAITDFGKEMQIGWEKVQNLRMFRFIKP